MPSPPDLRTLPRLLVALPDGRLVDHPALVAPVRSGDFVGVPIPRDEAIAMPAGGTLSSLPGQRPVGLDPRTGAMVTVEQMRIGRRTVHPDAVAAVLPPGYTRTYLPASARTSASPHLPQWAYTATGWTDRTGIVVHALHTDRRSHWSTRRYCTPDLEEKVARRCDESPLLRHLAGCALEYRCFTAQNVFYARDEGALPAAPACNARCAGCISSEKHGQGTASHHRIPAAWPVRDMVALAVSHLERASDSGCGRVMISFGQGCEGEPLTQAGSIAQVVRAIRERTPRGSININTNGSRPRALALLAQAGIDACRVSINSARRELYEKYYRPVDYRWADVRESLRVARDAGIYIAINLLTFPGVTDRAAEVDALENLLAEFRVHQVQTRNLAIDPDRYLSIAREAAHASPAVGVREMIRRLKRARPGLVIGNFARGLRERPGWQPAGGRPVGVFKRL